MESLIYSSFDEGIDDSFTNSYPKKKKQKICIAESEESSSEGEESRDNPNDQSKSSSRSIQSSNKDEHIVFSSEEDSDEEEPFAATSRTFKNRRAIISDDDDDDDEDDGPDEDQMVMSRATRMSIMGVIPKENDSDESDFIESDDSHRKSADTGVLTGSLEELPFISVDDRNRSETIDVTDECSRLTCSPTSTPLNTNEILDLTRSFSNIEDRVKTERIDDDVAIIDSELEIIELSSDEEFEAKAAGPSRAKKSPKPKIEDLTLTIPRDNTIKSYLAPPSYPNQGVVYVKQDVRQNELNKLNGLQEDLHNIRHLLDNMDVETLPDKGVKLLQRLTGLENEVRRQGDKVSNMIVEPDDHTAAEIAKKSIHDGLSWEEIQKASNEVQPRMFGRQAMATHVAERGMILERLSDLHKSLASCPPETKLADHPKGVKTKLMPHQLHALAWLRWRETQRPTAGILADDMGLGKTITMIALMVSDKENRIDEDTDDELPSKSGKLSKGGTLVVCPASLMQQWAGEVSKHCTPHMLSVCQHHGPKRSTQPHRLATYDLVLTTYNILQRDNDKNGAIMRVRWKRVILDEAHVVRNHKSATSVAVSALPALRRWCLTGTPIQNKDLDLFALLKFLRCSPFDELTMWKKWIDNRSLGGQERLSTIMRCILLRRTKQQLQQRGQLDCLPERTPHQQQVTLTKAEMNVYQKVLVFSKTLFAQFLHQRAEKQADSARGFTTAKDSEYAIMHKRMIALQGSKPVKSHEILVLLLRLRQVCCHCGLISAMLDEEGAGDVYEDPGGKDLLTELNKLSLEDANSKNKSKTHDDHDDDNDAEVEDAAEQGTTVTEAIRSVLSLSNPVFALDKPSSKIKAVMDCLKENVFSNKGEKAIVVSQWTSVLRLVESELTQLKVRSVTLSGVVPVPARPPLIDLINDPNSDVRVMLLSLCAGGVGLNLCGANHLLLLDPHWNPQLEEQAQDRIYRVGQKKPVHIYRFMCADTVEQTIRKLQEAKLELAANVLTGARNTNASKLTIEDLKMLFNMGQQE